MDACSTNMSVMSALGHCYPRYVPLSVLLQWQLAKLLGFLNSTGRRIDSCLPTGVHLPKQCRALAEAALRECEVVYGSDHSMYVEILNGLY